MTGIINVDAIFICLDVVQELYLKELKGYKPAPVSLDSFRV